MILKLLTRYYFFYFKEGYLFSLLAFYLLLLSLYPFCFGSALPPFSGLVWFTTLLSSLLSLEMIFNKDMDDGSLDLFYLTNNSLEFFSLIKYIIHWLLTTFPFIILLLFSSFDLIFSILLGSPTLSFIGGIGASFGLKNKSTIVSLMVVPLYIPILIFGSTYQWNFLFSLLLFLCSLAPIVSAIALKQSFL